MYHLSLLNLKNSHNLKRTHHNIVNLRQFVVYLIVRYWQNAKLATGRRITIWASCGALKYEVNVYRNEKVAAILYVVKW